MTRVYSRAFHSVQMWQLLIILPVVLSSPLHTQYNVIIIVGGDNRIMSRSLNICEHEVIALNIFSLSIPAVMTIYRTFTDKL